MRHNPKKKVVNLPTSRYCDEIGAGCYVGKAHMGLNDTIDRLNTALHNVEPRSEQAHQDVQEIRSLLGELRRLEDKHRDALMRLTSDCEEIMGCKRC